MQIKNFDDAFTVLIDPKHEGSEYSDHPNDPGGRTMYGVTERVARANGYTGPMHLLPLNKAKEIAKAEYWDALRLDELNSAEMAFQIFDVYYNGGRAVKWAQEAAGAVADGSMGPKTIEAINSVDPHVFMLRYNASRIEYLCALPTWPSFGKGWMRRIAANLREGAD